MDADDVNRQRQKNMIEIEEPSKNLSTIFGCSKQEHYQLKHASVLHHKGVVIFYLPHP